MTTPEPGAMTVHSTAAGAYAAHLPEKHTFSARWLATHLGDMVDVTVTVRTAHGPVAYRLDGFGAQQDAAGRPDFATWRTTKITPQQEG